MAAARFTHGVDVAEVVGTDDDFDQIADLELFAFQMPNGVNFEPFVAEGRQVVRGTER